MNFPRLLGVTVAALLLSPSAAGAQSAGCGNGSGVTRASVSIESPAYGATVSGANVVVSGSATAALVGSINRVEVTFGGVTRVRTYENSASVRFDIPFDTRELSPGSHSISAVVCGLLQWGSDRVDVTVEGAPAGTTTTAATPTALTTAPPGTAAANTATTVTATTRPGQTSTSTPASTTVGSSAPSTTAGPVPTSTPVVAGVTGVSQPARPADEGDGPLMLTEAPDRDSPRPPLWVGAVVGISGGLGLLFSAASWRRRGAGGPEVAEPVDPDLIEVG